jgi:hypothetical protein
MLFHSSPELGQPHEGERNGGDSGQSGDARTSLCCPSHLRRDLDDLVVLDPQNVELEGADNVSPGRRR